MVERSILGLFLRLYIFTVFLSVSMAKPLLQLEFHLVIISERSNMKNFPWTLQKHFACMYIRPNVHMYVHRLRTHEG